MVNVRVMKCVGKSLSVDDYKVHIKGNGLDRSFVVHWNGIDLWFDEKDERILRRHFTDEVLAWIEDTITERLKSRTNRRDIVIP